MKIIVDGVSKRFNREWIIRKLSYTFEPGIAHAVTGPNGAGKSTLLSLLSGQVPPSEGTITYINGERQIPVEDVYTHLALAAPYMDLIEELTLEEHVDFHFKLKQPRPGLTVAKAIERMYLERARKKTLGDFSSGMKQRVRLGLAFYTQSRILILDEPATNLDAQAYNWYRVQLAGLPPECLVIIASNNPAEYPENSRILQLQDLKK